MMIVWRISVLAWKCFWTARAWWVYLILCRSWTKRWLIRPRIALCFLIFSTLTGAASFVSSSGLPPRPPDYRRAELWIFFVFALARRRNRCLHVLTCGFSSFAAGKRRHLIPYRCPAVSSSYFSCDHCCPRQIGVFVCLSSDARIQTLDRPR